MLQSLFYTTPLIEDTHCFVINLDSDTEKWQNTKKVTESLGFTTERFSATLGKTIDIVNSKEITRFGKVFTEPAAIGIFMSHKRVWETVLSRGISHALIVEDDLFIDLPERYVKTELQASMSELPSGWDVVYFGHFGYVGSPSEVSTLLSTVIRWNPALWKNRYMKVTEHLNTPAFPVGLHAYMVSEKGCKKLLEAVQICNSHLDMTIANLYATGGWQVYALERRLLHQTSIKASGAGVTTMGSGGWWYKQIARALSGDLDLPYEPSIETSLSFSVCTNLNWKVVSLLTGIVAVTSTLAGAVTVNINYTLVGCGFLLLNALDLINGFRWSKPVVILANTAVCLVCGIIGRVLVRRVNKIR